MKAMPRGAVHEIEVAAQPAHGIPRDRHIGHVAIERLVETPEIVPRHTVITRVTLRSGKPFERLVLVLREKIACAEAPFQDAVDRSAGAFRDVKMDDDRPDHIVSPGLRGREPLLRELPCRRAARQTRLTGPMDGLARCHQRMPSPRARAWRGGGPAVAPGTPTVPDRMRAAMASAAACVPARE